MNRQKMRIGELLIESNKITLEDLNWVLDQQMNSGKRIGQLLLKNELIVEDDLLNALEIQLKIPKVSIESLDVDKDIVKLIPEKIVNKYTLFPIRIKAEKVQVVMSDPLNIFALDDLKIISGYEVEPLISSTEDIKSAISKYYSSQHVEDAAEELTKEQIPLEVLKNHEELENIKNAPAVKLVDSIIVNAVKARASDIHIEPFEKYIRIRYRVDGELLEVLRPAKETLGALVTRIKILSNLNIAEKRLPQDGRIITQVDGKDVDLRVSILPTVYGEKVVIRVLTKSKILINKANLGFDQDDVMKLDKIVSSPYGIILVTGPTGSGKSTTLYAVLNEINTENKNIVTVEDPVEYLLEGINQVNVNVKAGLTFAKGLRSILRQDPDIVMIGEIRDEETAEIAIRAAITGHLVLSTIHTNDAPSAIVRLTDMGIEPFLVATSIIGVIAQRLVRRICKNCKENYFAENYEKKMLSFDINKQLILSKGRGCNQCSNTGYLGRVGIYELMEITKKHREYILENKSTDNIRDLSLRQGMKTINTSCCKLVLNGITTIEELVKISQVIE